MMGGAVKAGKKRGCKRAADTLDHVQSIWMKDEES